LPARGAGDAEDDALSGDPVSVGAIYERFLAEYHIGPDELNNNWTEERLQLFLDKRNERLQLMEEQLERARHGGAPKRRVSDSKLFQMMGISVSKD
jgi:hypothetical protein